MTATLGRGTSWCRSKGRRLGEKRPYWEVKAGEERNRDTESWFEIYRIIDGANDRYAERLVNADGEVVRTVNSSLSENRGHGSDRSQDKAPLDCQIGLLMAILKYPPKPT